MRYIAIVCVLLVVFAVAETRVHNHLYGPSSTSAAASPQDTVYLDRRISLLETKIYSIESSLRTIEQQVSLSRSAPAQPARDPETALVRSEVEILKARIREIECGLAHIDERTLSAAAKESRKRAGAQPQDPCRLDPETPIQLAPRR